jgi:hypothetical protein
MIRAARLGICTPRKCVGMSPFHRAMSSAARRYEQNSCDCGRTRLHFAVRMPVDTLGIVCATISLASAALWSSIELRYSWYGANC